MITFVDYLNSIFHFNNQIEKKSLYDEFGEWKDLLDRSWQYFKDLMKLHEETQEHSDYYLSTRYLIDVYGPRYNSSVGYPLWFKIYDEDRQDWFYDNGVEVRLN